MTRWESLLAAGSRWSARLGGAAILGSALLVAAEVVVRNLGIGLRLHSFELTNYAFAAAVAFGFAYALTQRAHIRIDLLYRFLPRWLRGWLDGAALASLALLGTGMAWQGWRVAAESFRLGARPNSTLDIPLVIPQSLWAIGLSWFAVVATLLAIAALADLLRGRFARLHNRAGIATGEDAEGKA